MHSFFGFDNNGFDQSFQSAARQGTYQTLIKYVSLLIALGVIVFAATHCGH